MMVMQIEENEKHNSEAKITVEGNISHFRIVFVEARCLFLIWFAPTKYLDCLCKFLCIYLYLGLCFVLHGWQMNSWK